MHVADLGNKDKGEFTVVDPDDDDLEMHVSSVGGGFVHVCDPVTVANKMAVNSDGSVNVVASSVTTPTGATQVIEENFQDIASTAGVDTIYTITNGTTLTIQTLESGSESGVGGSVAELYEDPNGDLSVLNIIDAIFTDASTTFVPINLDFDGDGTRRIVMRQRGYNASAREMFSRWVGYEE